MARSKLPKVRGIHAHRYSENPEELRFAKAWDEADLLKYLLGDGDGVKRVEVSERDETVAATVIQWLGSSVGESFLEELGYKRTNDDE